MRIGKVRSALYASAKILGDVQAANKAVKRKSVKPIFNRAGKRMAGKITGRLLGKLFTR